MTRETGDVVVSARAAAKTIDDAKRVEIVMGAPSPLAAGALYPRLMNHVLGTKFRVVLGYDGFAAAQNAMERGEVDGIAGDTWYTEGLEYRWWKAGSIRILLQIGNKAEDLPGVPLLTDLATNDDDRKLLDLFSSPYVVGKPTAAGPKVPAERVAALRAAYAATMADSDFRADAQKLGIAIAPVSGEELGALVRRLAALPEPLVTARAGGDRALTLLPSRAGRA